MPADLATEDLFEVAQSVEGFEDATPKWTVAVGGQHAWATVQHDPAKHHGGSGSLRVEYDFVGKKDYEYIQVDSAWDLMGAQLPEAKLTEATENPVYITGRNVTLRR